MTLRLGPADVARAVALLRQGALVAFPTETVYGLGANGLDEAAVGRIFAAKGRPSDNPLILHVTDAAMAHSLVADWPERAEALAARFWPGPLTLVLRRGPGIPDAATAGLDTVALRAPAHPLAQAVVRGLGAPVAAPSANRSGRPSPTTAAAVLADLDGRIDAVLDGGPTRIGVESTVLDLTSHAPAVLRPGGLPTEALAVLLGPVRGPGSGPARSPGMRHRHYAPRMPLFLAGPGPAAVAAVLAAHPGAGLLVTDDTAAALAGMASTVVRLGPAGAPGQHARRLFAGLLALEEAAVPAVVAESVEEAGLGAAVMDRLRRAASASHRDGVARDDPPAPGAGASGAGPPRRQAGDLAPDRAEPVGSWCRRTNRYNEAVQGASLLFVCSGNTCRSPMAAALARRRGVVAASAGVCVPSHGEAAPEAVRLFPELQGHRSRDLTPAAVAAADLIVAMTPELAQVVRTRFPDAADRVLAWNVPDPVGRGPEAYLDARRRLAAGLRDLALRGRVPMHIAVGSDHAGFRLKEETKVWLDELGASCEDCGTTGEESVDYPDFAVAVAEAVSSGGADAGILVCASGIGMSMAANRVPGVRAAVCRDIYDARVTRNDNDANVLCLGGRITAAGLAREIVREFLQTPFAGGRHARRLAKLSDIEIVRGAGHGDATGR